MLVVAHTLSFLGYNITYIGISITYPRGRRACATYEPTRKSVRRKA